MLIFRLQAGMVRKRVIYYFTSQHSYYEAHKFFVKAKNGIGGRNSIDYALTLDCAKHIAMIQRNEKGKQARQYFIKCEEKFREISKRLSTLDLLKIGIERLREQEEREAAIKREKRP